MSRFLCRTFEFVHNRLVDSFFNKVILDSVESSLHRLAIDSRGCVE